MVANSAISWTTHTFNGWWGCFKVSEGCRNCYAETFAKRTGRSIWGPPATTERRFFADKHWQEPLKWNAAAEKAGERARVFSASMSDVFEDHPEVGPHRDRLFRLVEQTPWLDWQLLTKRPENILRMIPEAWHTNPPPNWWQGTSVENQDAADARIPHLLRVPAPVRFLSCEPLLGPVDLRSIPDPSAPGAWRFDALAGGWYLPASEDGYPEVTGDGPDMGGLISWVIVGGESGPKHRPMNVDWLASLVDQCQEAGVAVWVKQDSGPYPGKQGRIPDDLMIQQLPEVQP